ncbi:MAG: MGMT family protein [Bradymonadaceae bacterium]
MDCADYESYEELSDLTDRQLDAVRREIATFKDRVYWLVRQIPRGRVANYGQIALYAGSPRAARAVGRLMKSSVREDVPLPWHRVVNAQGGISIRGGGARAREQRRRLEDEGIAFDDHGRIDLAEYRWKPDVLFWEDEPDR